MYTSLMQEPEKSDNPLTELYIIMSFHMGMRKRHRPPGRL